MKQQYLIAIIFTLLLVGILFFLFSPKEPLSKEERVASEITAIEKSIAGKEGPVLLQLTETPEEWKPVIEFCAQQPEGEGRDRCLYHKALDYNETLLCYQMSGLEWQGKCFRGVAINLDNIRLCNVITHPYQKNRCVTFFGIKHKDPEICNLVEDANLRTLCLKFAQP